MEATGALFDPTGFVPRAVCGAWIRGEVLLNNVSDLLIALAYVAIPVILIYFARRRHDLPLTWILLVFGAFIIACAMTHTMEIVLFYHPIYRLAGAIKLVTALVSWGAVAALVKVAPILMALRSPQELEAVNRELSQEILERKAMEAELREKNSQLRETEQLKDEFLANVSHELRTPLTLVLSPLEHLLDAPSEELALEDRQALEVTARARDGSGSCHRARPGGAHGRKTRARGPSRGRQHLSFPPGSFGGRGTDRPHRSRVPLLSLGAHFAGRGQPDQSTRGHQDAGTGGPSSVRPRDCRRGPRAPRVPVDSRTLAEELQRLLGGSR
ncbi:MAG: hypothetical protein HY319_07230 [Armatimonadetes bacterium]|nr:hypothetical protein [Armatimonadota bacterium]